MSRGLRWDDRGVGRAERVGSRDDLLSHPVVGTSWEGFVIENILGVLAPDVLPSFYRSAAGAEIDLVLEFPGGGTWAIEIKRSATARPGRGFHHARADLRPARSLMVHGGSGRHPLGDGVEAVGLGELVGELVGAGRG